MSATTEYLILIDRERRWKLPPMGGFPLDLDVRTAARDAFQRSSDQIGTSRTFLLWSHPVIGKPLGGVWTLLAAKGANETPDWYFMSDNTYLTPLVGGDCGTSVDLKEWFGSIVPSSSVAALPVLADSTSWERWVPRWRACLGEAPP